MKPWGKNPVIYEINTWVWLEEISQRYQTPVTLANVPDSIWDELANLQIDAAWLMGVWERSPRGIAISNKNSGNLADFRKALPDFSFADNVGSPYCIRRYIADQNLGGPDGLAIARKKLADRGINLILDFVPNHVAHDHPWVEEFPDYFIRGDQNDLQNDPVTFVQIDSNIFACGKDPYYPAWQDVVQVNAFRPGLREKAIETTTRIAGLCDGVRCDMAMLMLNKVVAQTWGTRAGSAPVKDYWEELVPAVKRTNSNFIFIAESYWDLEWELMQQGFDYCYDKRLYDRLEKNERDLVRLHLTADPAYQSRLLRFIENHDEPRAAAIFSLEKEKMLALAIATLPGAKLFHEGQFEGRKIKLPVFLRRRPDEHADPCQHGFYSTLLAQIKQELFHDGQWQWFEPRGWTGNTAFQNLLSWGWSSNEAQYVVVINMSGAVATGQIPIPWDFLKGENWRLADPLSGISFDRNGDEMVNPGLYVSLPAWGTHFFRVVCFDFGKTDHARR